MEETVILVNEADEVVGTGEKMRTHVVGALHRAFSIFVFNSSGKLLVQKRSRSKYHSGNLWSNTCCGHPRPGESIKEASHRRLKEEMGFDCELKEIFSFIYRAELDNDLLEHEYDHVLVGTFNDDPKPNSDEVDDWEWVDPLTIKKRIRDNPDKYTYWLRLSLHEVINIYCG